MYNKDSANKLYMILYDLNEPYFVSDWICDLVGMNCFGDLGDK